METRGKVIFYRDRSEFCDEVIGRLTTMKIAFEEVFCEDIPFDAPSIISRGDNNREFKGEVGISEFFQLVQASLEPQGT